MPRRAQYLLSLSLLMLGLSSGCALMDTGKNWFSDKRYDQSEPEGEAPPDKWAFVGKEGRGGRNVEQGDWLENLMWSDKAKDINRNFGYE